MNRAVELSLVGQNLLDNQHLEYIQETFTQATEVQRSVYGKVVWEF
jgi:iron complex outermembrane receptor protein